MIQHMCSTIMIRQMYSEIINMKIYQIITYTENLRLIIPRILHLWVIITFTLV